MERILSKNLEKYEDQEIKLSGWVDSRRDHGKIIFIDLRDRSGITQVVFIPKDKELYEKADTLRSEWVIEIMGEVKRRPDGMENKDISSGIYEIKATSLNILTKADTPPIDIKSDGGDIGEDTRMKYRYLDLRRKRLNENIKKRSYVVNFIRNYLNKENFVEIETPVLGKSTPEGARDYLVPSRLQPGKFYALPQSPQQYKQLLMVAGFERYYQLVKCFRDEDTRGDRQPEFTQVDMELSFTTEEEIMTLVEGMFLDLVKEVYPDKKLSLGVDGKIPRMTYDEAIENYNSDRPDIRKDKEDKDELAFVFVTDFPAFEKKEGKGGRWAAVHHPFTMPKIDNLEKLKEEFKKDPASIKACQYDLVLNGYEVAGGSIRIYNSELLSTIFELLGHSKESINERFGHLLEAFKYGVPPHGGIAVGFDRIMMILQNEPNIREVIAFPKSGDGQDLMMGAPAEVDNNQIDELHIKIKKENK
jgi:aspartyl-tRNA synthetase